ATPSPPTHTYTHHSTGYTISTHAHIHTPLRRLHHLHTHTHTHTRSHTLHHTHMHAHARTHMHIRHAGRGAPIKPLHFLSFFISLFHLFLSILSLSPSFRSSRTLEYLSRHLSHLATLSHHTNMHARN